MKLGVENLNLKITIGRTVFNFHAKLQFLRGWLLCFSKKRHFFQNFDSKCLDSLSRSVPKLLKVPNLARSVPKPLQGRSLTRSVPKPLTCSQSKRWPRIGNRRFLEVLCYLHGNCYETMCATKPSLGIFMIFSM